SGRMNEKEKNIIELSKKMREREDALAQLVQRVEVSEQNNAKLQETLQLTERDGEKMRNELSTIKQREMKTSSEIKTLMGTMEQMQKQHQGSSEAELMQRIEAELQRKLDRLRTEMDETHGLQIAQMKQQMREQHKREIEELNTIHRSELDKMSSIPVSHMVDEEQVDLLNSAINELNIKLRESHVQRDQLKQEYARREEEYKNEVSGVERRHEQKVLELRYQLSQAHEQVQNLSNKHTAGEQHSKEVELLTAALKELRAQVAEMNAAKMELQSKYEQEVMNYQIKLEMMEREKDAVLDRMAESQEAELERLRTELMFSHEEELRALKDTLAKKHLQEQDTLKVKQKQQVDHLQSEMDTKNAAIRAKCDELSAEKAGLLVEVSTMKSDIENLKKGQGDDEDMIKQIEMLKAEVGTLRSVQKDLHERELQMKELQAANKQVIAAREKLEQQLADLQKAVPQRNDVDILSPTDLEESSSRIPALVEQCSMLEKQLRALKKINETAKQTEYQLREELEKQHNTFVFSERNFEVNMQELREEHEQVLKEKSLIEVKLEVQMEEVKTLKSELLQITLSAVDTCATESGGMVVVESRKSQDLSATFVEKDSVELMEKMQVVERERDHLVEEKALLLRMIEDHDTEVASLKAQHKTELTKLEKTFCTEKQQEIIDSHQQRDFESIPITQSRDECCSANEKVIFNFGHENICAPEHNYNRIENCITMNISFTLSLTITHLGTSQKLSRPNNPGTVSHHRLLAESTLKEAMTSIPEDRKEMALPVNSEVSDSTLDLAVASGIEGPTLSLIEGEPRTQAERQLELQHQQQLLALRAQLEYEQQEAMEKLTLQHQDELLLHTAKVSNLPFQVAVHQEAERLAATEEAWKVQSHGSLQAEKQDEPDRSETPLRTAGKEMDLLSTAVEEQKAEVSGASNHLSRLSWFPKEDKALLEEVFKEHVNMVKHLQSECGRLKDQCLKLQEQLVSELDSLCTSLNETHQRDMENVRALLTVEHQKEAASLKEAHSKDLDDLRSSLKEQHKYEVEKVMVAVKEAQHMELQSLRSFLGEMQDRRQLGENVLWPHGAVYCSSEEYTSVEALCAGLVKQHAGEMEKLKREQKELLQELQESFNQKLANLQVAHAAETDAQSALEVAALKEAQEEEVKALTQQLEAQCEKHVCKAVQKLRGEHREELEALLVAHEEELKEQAEKLGRQHSQALQKAVGGLRSENAALAAHSTQLQQAHQGPRTSSNFIKNRRVMVTSEQEFEQRLEHVRAQLHDGTQAEQRRVKQNERSQEDLMHVQAQLECKQEAMDRMSEELTRVQEELKLNQVEMEQNQVDLEHVQEKLMHVQAELERKQVEQERMQAELERTKRETEHKQEEMEHVQAEAARREAQLVAEWTEKLYKNSRRQHRKANEHLLHVLSEVVRRVLSSEESIARRVSALMAPAPEHAGTSAQVPAGIQLSTYIFSADEGEWHEGQMDETSSARSAATDEGLELSQRLSESIFSGPELETAGEELVLGSSARLQAATSRLLDLLAELSRQLEQARAAETELVSECSRRTHDAAGLAERLAHEAKAREQLALELHKAEAGLLEGYVAEKLSLQTALQEREASERALAGSLEAARGRLTELETEQQQLDEERRLLERQRHAMAASATGAQMGLLHETEKMAQEKRRVEQQAERGAQELHGRLRALEVALDEALVRNAELEKERHAEASDLQQQVLALEKQLKHHRQFMEEQAADREHEREEFQQEIKRLEGQLKQQNKATPAERASREVEGLEEAVRVRRAREAELLREHSEQRSALSDRAEEAERQAQRATAQLQQQLLSLQQARDDLAQVRVAPPTGVIVSRRLPRSYQLQEEKEANERKSKEITHLEEQLEQFREELLNKSEETGQLQMQLEIQRKQAGHATQLQQGNTHMKKNILVEKVELSEAEDGGGDRRTGKKEQVLLSLPDALLQEKNAEIDQLTLQVQQLTHALQAAPPSQALQDENEELRAEVRCLRSDVDRLRRQHEEELERTHEVIARMQRELPHAEATLRTPQPHADSLLSEMEQHSLEALAGDQPGQSQAQPSGGPCTPEEQLADNANEQEKKQVLEEALRKLEALKETYEVVVEEHRLLKLQLAERDNDKSALTEQLGELQRTVAFQAAAEEEKAAAQHDAAEALQAQVQQLLKQLEEQQQLVERQAEARTHRQQEISATAAEEKRQLEEELVSEHTEAAMWCPLCCAAPWKIKQIVKSIQFYNPHDRNRDIHVNQEGHNEWETIDKALMFHSSLFVQHLEISSCFTGLVNPKLSFVTSNQAKVRSELGVVSMSMEEQTLALAALSAQMESSTHLADARTAEAAGLAERLQVEFVKEEGAAMAELRQQTEELRATITEKEDSVQQLSGECERLQQELKRQIEEVTSLTVSSRPASTRPAGTQTEADRSSSLASESSSLGLGMASKTPQPVNVSSYSNTSPSYTKCSVIYNKAGSNITPAIYRPVVPSVAEYESLSCNLKRELDMADHLDSRLVAHLQHQQLQAFGSDERSSERDSPSVFEASSLSEPALSTPLQVRDRYLHKSRADWLRVVNATCERFSDSLLQAPSLNQDILTVLHWESEKVLALSENTQRPAREPLEGADAQQGAGTGPGVTSTWLQEKRVLLQNIAALKELLVKMQLRKPTAVVCKCDAAESDWRGEFIRALLATFDAERRMLLVSSQYLAAEFRGPGLWSTLVHRGEEQERMETSVLAGLEAAERASLLSELGTLRSEGRVAALQHQEEAHRLQADMASQLELLECKLQQEQAVGAELQTELGMERSHGATLQREAARERERAATLEGQLARLQAELDSAVGTWHQHAAQAQALLRAELQEKEGEISRLREALSASRVGLAQQLHVALEKATAHSTQLSSTLEQEREAAVRHQRDLEAERNSLKLRLTQLQAALAAEKQHVGELQVALTAELDQREKAPSGSVARAVDDLCSGDSGEERAAAPERVLVEEREVAAHHERGLREEVEGLKADVAHAGRELEQERRECKQLRRVVQELQAQLEEAAEALRQEKQLSARTLASVRAAKEEQRSVQERCRLEHVVHIEQQEQELRRARQRLLELEECCRREQQMVLELRQTVTSQRSMGSSPPTLPPVSLQGFAGTSLENTMQRLQLLVLRVHELVTRIGNRYVATHGGDENPITASTFKQMCNVVRCIGTVCNSECCLSTRLMMLLGDGSDEELEQMQRSLNDLSNELRQMQSTLPGSTKVLGTTRPLIPPLTPQQGTGRVSLELSERLLQQNSELTGLVSLLTQEKEDLRSALTCLQQDARRQQQQRVEGRRATEFSADCGVTESQRLAEWLKEKLSLQAALQESETEVTRLRAQQQREALRRGSPQPDVSNSKMQRLYGRYLKAESFRKALVYQKRYLLLLLGGFRDCEQATLALIARMGAFPSQTDTRPPGAHSRAFTRFRSAVRVVIAISRLRFMVRKWQRATRSHSPMDRGGGSASVSIGGNGMVVRVVVSLLQSYGLSSTHSYHNNSVKVPPFSNKLRQQAASSPLAQHMSLSPAHVTYTSQTQDPERSLTDYIGRLEALQHRLGGLQPGKVQGRSLPHAVPL
uniref:Pericentrin/AKAP-450 centrosomal targeting domain-containing protein n=1 Tax=Petromyzon marinus TaxID=7757 RepID=S4RT64_PETMA